MTFKPNQEVQLEYSDKVGGNVYSTIYKVNIIEHRRAKEDDGINPNYEGKFMLHKFKVLEILSGTGHPEIKEDTPPDNLEIHLLPQIGEIQSSFSPVDRRKRDQEDNFPKLKFSRIPKKF